MYVPEDWCNLVENARRQNAFHVIRMTTEDFTSTRNVRSEIVYRKTNTNGNKVEWLNIRWLQVSKDKPFEIQYRYSHNTLEAWKTLDVCRKRQGRPSDLGSVSLVPLYRGFRPINVKKLQDLLALIDFIPPVHHAFYNELESTAADCHSEEEVEQDQ